MGESLQSTTNNSHKHPIYVRPVTPAARFCIGIFRLDFLKVITTVTSSEKKIVNRHILHALYIIYIVFQYDHEK